MKITGTHTTTSYVVVNVGPKEVWKQLRKELLRAHGLQKAEHLREQNGKPVFKADDEHRHGSVTESVVIDDPSIEQVAVWNTLAAVQVLVDQLEKAQWPK